MEWTLGIKDPSGYGHEKVVVAQSLVYAAFEAEQYVAQLNRDKINGTDAWFVDSIHVGQPRGK